MKIQFSLSDAAHAILHENATSLSPEGRAALTAATQLTHQGGQTGVTYEFDCSDTAGNEIRKLFESLDGEFKQQGNHAKSRTCYLAASDIAHEIAKGAQVKKL